MTDRKENKAERIGRAMQEAGKLISGMVWSAIALFFIYVLWQILVTK